ncbi:hypothetical protein QQ054_09955 [Oscillatoria amoena NRMC-F 0135]|nr:hypothetical protein [Oscillatoria amoena NRMC-F 0135]
MRVTGRYIATFGLVLLGVAVKAQDTTLSIRDVTVISDYVPYLADAVKEKTAPVAEAPDAPLPKLSYSIIPIQFRTVSRLDIPKALEMGKNTPPNLRNNHIRLGFGNYASPLAEIYLHNKRSEYSAYGLTIKHLSANGPDKAIFSDNNVSLFGKRFFKTGTLFGDFDYVRNGLRFYGFDRTFPYTPSDDSLKQVYNTFAVSTGWESKEWGKRKMQFKGDVAFHNLTDKWGAQENDATINTSFKTLIKEDVLKVNLAYSYSSYSDSLGSLNRNFVHLNPRYTPNGDKLKLTLGVNSSVYVDTAKPKFYLFPVVDAEYEIEKGFFSAIAGVNGGLQKNTLRSFITENAFLSNRIAMGNTVNRFEGYLGIKGKANANFGFIGRVFYNQFNDMAVFIADSTVLRRFKPLYIDAHVIRFNAELAYQYSEKVRLNLTANVYNYKVQDSKQKAWQLPTAEVKLNTTYNIGNKLLLSADVFVMNQRPATSEYTTLPATNLKAFADFNFGMEYRYRKTLSLFVRLNNISSVRYQRWYNYPTYSLNGMGGITFSL